MQRPTGQRQHLGSNGWVPLRNERALRFHELAGFKREMSTAKTSVVGSVKIEEVRLQRPLN